MAEQVAVVETNGHKTADLSDKQSGGVRPPDDARRAPERQAGKFVYAGGSRPLDGYTIKRGIGQGGFGEIYYAVNDAGKEVALKLVRRNLDVELRGIRHCLNLKHPDLLDLYDIRQDKNGDTWVVMEYISGRSLEDALEARPEGLPIAQVLAWFHGIAAGVAYLHDRGIVHRDLKPGNVFSAEGVVKVGDYGLSKFISCSRRSGHTESIGTVHYMAPEVANGRYGKEIDIYAMGIILYEMLTGRVPFDGESVGEVLMKHLTAEPDVSMLGEPYRSVVRKALEKDPANRFRSVGEMVAALPQPAQAPAGVVRLPSDTSAENGAAGGASGGAKRGGAGGFADTVVRAQVADEEPIARLVRETWWRLRSAWDQANLNAPAKVALLILAIFLLLAGSKVLVPLAVGLLILYGAYRLVRAIVLSASGSATTGVRLGPSAYRGQAGASPYGPPQAAPPQPFAPPRPVGPPPGAPGAVPPRAVRPLWRRSPREKAMAALVVKAPRERLTDLLGSMLLGALVALAMGIVTVALISYGSGVPRPEVCAWVILTSIVGTWTVLIPAKFWEGTRGEVVLRRFVMMVVGLGLGAAASAVAVGLTATLPPDGGLFEAPNYGLAPNLYLADGRPLAIAYMAAFGTLFLVLRWWRQADPLRRTRLSLFALAVSVLVAAVVAGLLHFPQPWLSAVAGIMSVSVQLSSPWMDMRRRTA